MKILLFLDQSLNSNKVWLKRFFRLRLSVFFIFLFCFFYSNLTQAQNSRAIANAKYEYNKAEQAYNQNNYTLCLEHLQKSESYRGNNILIQYLRCKSRFAMNDLAGTEMEIEKFYKMAPNNIATDARFMEIVEIERSIDDKKNAEFNLYSSASKANDIDMLKQYTVRYTHGKYLKKAQSQIAYIQDKTLLSSIKNSGSVVALENYIELNPNGSRIDSVTKAYNEMEQALHEECMSDPSSAILLVYLNDFKIGKHRDEIELKLLDVKEYELYQKTKVGNSIYHQKAYLLTYPNGKYKNDVQENLETSLIESARQQYQLEQYAQTNRYCEDYLIYFQEGKYKQEVLDILLESYYQEGAFWNNAKNWPQAFAAYYSYFKQFPKGNHSYSSKSYMQSSSKKYSKDHYIKLIDRLTVAEALFFDNDMNAGMENFKISLLDNSISYDQRVKSLYNVSKLEVKSEKDRNGMKEIAALAIKLNPDQPAIIEASGEIYYKIGDLENAKMSFSKSFKSDPTLMRSCYRICQIDMKLMAFESLFKDANNAIRQFPEDGTAYGYLGRSKFHMGKYDESLKDYQKGISYASDAENESIKNWLLNWKATTYFEQNEYDQADKILKSILTTSPDDPFTLKTYSYQLAVRNERLGEAMVMIKKAIEENGTNAHFYDTYAFVLYKNDRYQDALLNIDLAIKISVLNHEIIDGMILEHKGDILFKMDDQTDALSYWRKAQKAGGGSRLLAKKISDAKLYE